MPPTPKKRPKPDSISPKPKRSHRNPKIPQSSSSSSSSSSSYSSFKLFMEPSTNLFPSKSDLLRLIAVIAIASSVAISCNFFVTNLYSQPKPFCDSNVDLEDSITDFCEPCPKNGECYQGKLECGRGYRKRGKLCIEDGDINEKAKKLSKLVETRLCEAHARFLCDGIGTVWAREDEIWNDLDELKLMETFGMDNSVYTHTKYRAMEAIDRLLEMRTNSQGMKELKCSDLLAEHYKSFTCQMRQWIFKNALVLVPVFTLLVGCILLFRKIRRRWHLSIRVEDLYHQVCDILEEHALTSKSVNGETEPWVVASWLRDHLLLPRERKDPLLWKKVEELVQEDSRLDLYPKLVKGESKVVWEWQVEGALSSSRMRKKGRVGEVTPSESTAIKFDKRFQEVKSGEVLN